MEVVYDKFDFVSAAKSLGYNEKEAAEYYWNSIRAMYELNTTSYNRYDLENDNYIHPDWVIKTILFLCDDEDEVVFGRE